MATAVRFDTPGAPDVLTLEETASLAPGPNEVWLEQAAIGVNFLDVTQRRGTVPVPLPSRLGLEGAGRVAAIGSEVSNVSVGDRVAYAMGQIGSYASGRLFPAERLIKLPDDLSFDDAAAVLFKGLTAQYLIKSTYPVKEGDVVLLYGAAGSVGQIIASWATHLGAHVIGVVSRETSVERAHAAGCRDVLVWGKSDVAAEVGRISNGQMADVVYDGVGRETFDASISSLKVRGMMVSFGASSGAPDPVSVGLLNKKSLFLTRPGLAAHIGDVDEYCERAQDVLDALQRGIIRPNIWKVFPLADVVKVHDVLEHGSSEGTIVMRP
jgi:NADPH:quinone reductase